MKQADWPTFPGDEARRNRKKMRRPKGRLTPDERGVHISTRHSEWGRMMESRVSGILEKMLEEQRIDKFTYHLPNSTEDLLGKDFTVWKRQGSAEIERSFGITINAHAGKIPPFRIAEEIKIPQWCLPINTKDETIRNKVLALLSSGE